MAQAGAALARLLPARQRSALRAGSGLGMAKKRGKRILRRFRPKTAQMRDSIVASVLPLPAVPRLQQGCSTRRASTWSGAPALHQFCSSADACQGMRRPCTPCRLPAAALPSKRCCPRGKIGVFPGVGADLPAGVGAAAGKPHQACLASCWLLRYQAAAALSDIQALAGALTWLGSACKKRFCHLPIHPICSRSPCMSDLSLARVAAHPASPLSVHARQCMAACGPMHRVRCAAEAAHGFLAHRFVTTLAVAAAVVAASGWPFFS